MNKTMTFLLWLMMGVYTTVIVAPCDGYAILRALGYLSAP